MKRVCAGVVLGIGALAAGAAWGESITATGLFPAQYRDAAMLRSIAVDRFAGRDGMALSLAIERALSQPDVDGHSHFAMVGPGAPADGVLSGAVSTGVEQGEVQRSRKQCVQRDDKNKCMKEEQQQVRCTQRIVNVSVDLRLSRTGDGRILYSTTKPVRDQIEWCPGESPSRTVEETVSNAIRTVAGQVRMEIAPHVENYKVRFRESTKGLDKTIASQFKAVVKQSQRDLQGACGGWATLDQQSPNHPSITFDLGVCAEARGDLQGALGWYRQAAPLIGGDSEASEGIDRIQRRMAADQDAAARRRQG